MARQPSFQRKTVYKDFDLSLTKNALTGDIGVKTDTAAINQSVKTLILTNFYERPFQPTVGSNARALLFEPADPLTIADLKNVIEMTLINFEPRIEVLDVSVFDQSDSNAYQVSIRYMMKDVKEVADAQIVLERLR